MSDAQGGTTATEERSEGAGTELVPASEGGELVHAGEVELLPGQEHAHPTPRQYVGIAVVLVILTALEVWLYYLEDTLPSNLIIVMLLTLAAVKFVLVVAWYMHLKTDRKIFRRFFVVGFFGALILYTIVLLTFNVLNRL